MSASVGEMPTTFVHTNIRVTDAAASVRFYRLLGYEQRGRLVLERSYNVYLGLPDDGDTLELTVDLERSEPYEHGDGYSHIALVVDDLDAMLARLAAAGIEPEEPPFAPEGRTEVARICFLRDPDGYQVELIDGGVFPTPHDPPHPATV